jgi:hypothetical protein
VVFGQKRIDVSDNVGVMKAFQQIHFHFGRFSFFFRDIFDLNDLNANKVALNFISHQINLKGNLLTTFRSVMKGDYLAEATLAKDSNGVISINTHFSA